MCKFTILASFPLGFIQRQLAAHHQLVLHYIVTSRIKFLQQLVDGFCAHFSLEVVTVFFLIGQVLLFAEELLLYQICPAGIQHDVLGKVEDFLQALLGNLQYLADSGGGTLEVPDVGHGSRQLNVTHTLTTHLGTGYLNAAPVADLALEADLLELTAVALPVLGGSKDPFAEQTVPLRLLGSVVDGFRTLHSTVGPVADLLRGCQADFNGVKS